MIRMRNLIVILILSVLTASCSRKTVPQLRTITKDSIITKTETKYKDTTIFIPGKEVIITDTLPCPDYFKTETKDGLTATASIKNGDMKVRCAADSLLIELRFLQQQLTWTQELKQQTIEVPVEVIKHKVPSWCWYLLIANVVIIAFWVGKQFNAFKFLDKFNR